MTRNSRYVAAGAVTARAEEALLKQSSGGQLKHPFREPMDVAHSGLSSKVDEEGAGGQGRGDQGRWSVIGGEMTSFRPVFVFAILGLALTSLAACGDDSDDPIPTTTATLDPSLETILDRPVTEADIDEIIAVAEAFYEAHPEANDWISGGTPFSKAALGFNLEGCQTGFQDDPSTIEESREARCAFVVQHMYGFYVQHGYEELLTIAKGVRNYFVNEFPERQAEFEDYLRTQRVN